MAFSSFRQFKLLSCNNRDCTGADTISKFFHQLSKIFTPLFPFKEIWKCNLQNNDKLKDPWKIITFLKRWGLLIIPISFFLIRFHDGLKLANLNISGFFDLTRKESFFRKLTLRILYFIFILYLLFFLINLDWMLCCENLILRRPVFLFP